MADKRVQELPLPDGKASMPETLGGLAVEWGWRVKWGRKIGQVDMPGGTVVEFEPDTEKATRRLRGKARELRLKPDAFQVSDGRVFWRDTRTGRYVEMDRTPRAR